MNNTILIIEDNQEMSENIAAILELAHYKVLAAPNGKAGVALAQENNPDLVLCDVMMPELDGYGVLHILNSDPKTAGIPFVFVTAKADRSDFRMGMDMGADDYITKPFDGFDLLKVIETRLRKKAFLTSTFGNDIKDVNNFFSKARELKEFQRLSGNRPMRTFKKKDVLFMEGQTPNDLYFISKGSVKTYKLNSDGKELITAIHREGDFIGYAPLLEDKAYSESCEALEESDILLIPRGDFISLLYSSREIAHKFIKLLSNNLEETEKRLLDLAYQSVRQRVAGALLSISDTYRLSDGNATIAISRKDISSMIGTATESLNRTLADFKDENLIEISDHHLKILNRQKLERVIR